MLVGDSCFGQRSCKILRTPLHVFDNGSVNVERNRQVDLKSYVRLFGGTVSLNSFLWTTMREHIGFSWLMSISETRIFNE